MWTIASSQMPLPAGVGIRDTNREIPCRRFSNDCKTLSIEEPEHWVRATDNIDEMVKLIQRLQEKLYVIRRSSIYYPASAKFPE